MSKIIMYNNVKHVRMSNAKIKGPLLLLLLLVSKLTEGAAMGCRVVEVLAGYLDMMPSMTLFTVLS